MNTFLDIDVDVLLTTARVQAALQVIPRIIGPKEAWAHWMRDNLDGELVSNPVVLFKKSTHLVRFPGQTSTSQCRLSTA